MFFIFKLYIIWKVRGWINNFVVSKTKNLFSEKNMFVFWGSLFWESYTSSNCPPIFWVFSNNTIILNQPHFTIKNWGLRVITIFIKRAYPKFEYFIMQQNYIWLAYKIHDLKITQLVAFQGFRTLAKCCSLHKISLQLTEYWKDGNSKCYGIVNLLSQSKSLISIENRVSKFS